MTHRMTFPIGIVFFSSILFSCKQKNTLPDFAAEPGFSLTLVASEPLIQDPVDMEFNEAGDALVLEMPGYPLADKQSKIKVLKDNDHNGIYDEEILFAENLRMATSIMPYRKGVLVSAPPFLFNVQDSNNDYVADVIDTLMGGFSTGNLQHNYNGLTYGLDNWIYAVNGGNSGKPYWWGDTTTMMDLRGQDFRFDLNRKVMERIGESSGGFGLAIDEWGRAFETHNTTHIAHLVFPDRYQSGISLSNKHTLSNISDHEERGLARIYPIGEQESRVNHPEQSGYFSGGCGITYYGGGAFGPVYSNTVWVADVVLNLIHVDKVKPVGASFAATRVIEKRDFIASSDRAFRPVNMTVGPDGAMYLVDMYRPVIEHPEWIPDEIEKELDLNAGKDKGRIYKITKAETQPPSFNPEQFKSVSGMLSSLEHPNQWVRKTAQRLLMDRPLSDQDLKRLSDLLQSPNEWARLHTLWIIESKRELKAEQLLKALHDPLAGIRENALIIAEHYQQSNNKILEVILRLCQDDNDRVRMQATLSISTIEKNFFDKHSEEIFTALMTSAAQPTDTWNLAAITLAAKHSPALLFKKLASSTNTRINEPLLASLALSANNSMTNIQIILEEINQPRFRLLLKANIISQLSKGSPANNSTRLLVPGIQALEKSDDIAIVAALASLRNKFGLGSSTKFLKLSQASLANVLNKSLPDSTRSRQLMLMEFLPFKEKSEVLFQCLQNNQPLTIQEAALRQLSTYPQPSIGWRLVKEWKTMGPATRRLAGDLLLYIEIHHDALLTGLEQGTINIGEMNFDLERRRMLLWWTDNEKTKQRAGKLFSDVGVINRKDAIGKMKNALSLTGDMKNGAIVFQTICSHCHMFGSQGKDVGPLLTEIGRKSKESLLYDILDPNAAADTQYINHRLETNSGAVHLGMVDSETDQQITIKKMGGATVTINKTDIKTFTSLGTSLMMEGLEGSMTPQELADLLAYLQKGID